jgi:tetratricopeptide (TPR) repeat protein
MRLLVASLLLLLGLGVVIAGRDQGDARPVEATSLFGTPLLRPVFPPETLARLQKDLADAQARYDADPSDPERVIWLGRRLAYLGRYRDAIATYTKGIDRHPGYAKLYRHRGHRHITVREFDRAIADLARAAELVAGQPDEIEPDGAPNKYNKPRSTLQSNILYHLGLAYYLKGEFAAALRTYLACMKVSEVNDDMLVATADWLYMTYRRLGREAEARAGLDRIHEKMEILENESYHRRLLMYKGLRTPESLLEGDGLDDLTLATQGYGVANWFYYNGETARAVTILEKVAASPNWAAFGTIAAEADLRAIRKSRNDLD